MPTSPLSASNHKLSELRIALGDLNRDLFKKFLARRALVEKIQQAKTATDAIHKSFDATREKQLFLDFHSELAQLSIHELLAFSILMEGQAGAPTQYPAWSEGVHLLEAPSHIEHRINPLLLQSVRPEAFAMIRLTSHFGFLRSI